MFWRRIQKRLTPSIFLLSRPLGMPRLKTPRDSAAYDALCFARTCYDHLAGQMGVALTQALIDKGLVTAGDEAYGLTEAATQWLVTWNIEEEALRQGRRLFARPCVDWSERRDHMAGALGSAITKQLFERGWIIPLPGHRAVHVTDVGRRGFRDEFGIDVGLNVLA